MRKPGVLAAVALLVVGCGVAAPRSGPEPAIGSWVYQLSDYADGTVGELAEAPQELAVIDIARDGTSDFFTADEIGELRDSGKKVLAYFEIGSIADFRPEYQEMLQQDPDLVLNNWPDWPEEYFGRFWEERWWDLVVRPRVDQALATGFDGVYLDVLLAYEEIDLGVVPGETRESLAAKMADLVVRISEYAKQWEPDFWIFPQNNPELRTQPGYVDAIDGIGMEELFYLNADEPCEQDWCADNLANVEALRDAGKIVLAVDYAVEPENVAAACDRYREEGFAGYVTTVDLSGVSSPCS